MIPQKKELVERTKIITDHILNSNLGDQYPIEFKEIKSKIQNFASDKELYFFGYHNFSNTGDQALWLSLTLIYKSLNIAGNENKLLTNQERSVKSNTKKEKVLIFPGGGSLGNRYQSSKNRISIIESNPGVQFIQMPASTSFADDRITLDRLKSAYKKNQGLIFCRDTLSTNESKEILKIKATTTPDLVEYLPSCKQFQTGELGEIHLLRCDQEATDRNKLIKKTISNSIDWDIIESMYPIPEITKQVAIWKLLSNKGLSRIFQNIDLIKILRFNAAHEISLLKTARAIAFLSFYKEIMTDRLHGVILSRNLGLDISYFDNDHGKIGRYISTWGDRYKSVKNLHKNQ
jgi:pyruvyl transferase EpsO